MAASLELAISAIRAGRKEEGRQLLNLLIQQNPNNEMAWVWMSSVVETDEQRARCLYHALAINPSSQLARRGLQVLGIVVSDSRPVKIPRDSQPIQIPRPTLSAQPQFPASEMPQPQSPSWPERTVTEELPFAPLQAASSEKIAASPTILQLNVDDFVIPEEGSNALPWMPGEEPGKLVPANHSEGLRATKTQQMASPFLQNGEISGAGAPNETVDLSQQTGGGGITGQPQGAEGMPPTDTRPSQPMPPIYPQGTPPGQFYYPAVPSHSNVTMGMPYQPYGQYPPAQPMAPLHSNPTMGMPLPPPNGYPMYPQGMGPELHSSNTMGMPVYPPAQYQMVSPYHSNSTLLMPTLSEAEARARLNASQAMPPVMAMQNPAPPPMGNDPDFNAQLAYYQAEPEGEEEAGEELNILAVIIFGTLSITALGGLGMLILLLFTSPMTSG
jgi:hypothetical protein